METLEGNVERITYYNPENGYCVLRLHPSQLRLGGNQQLVTVVGNMPELQPGENVKLNGEWLIHHKHGRQFKAETVVQLRPATLEGITRYLGSGMIRGVGKKTAKSIVDFFGADTLDILDRQPERVTEVPGVGKVRARSIAESWAEQQEIKRVMLFLQSHGINTSLALRIYKQYEDESLNIVQQDPYRMVSDVFGIGFLTADRIAREVGLPVYAPSRIRAGLIYALNEAQNDGHVYLPTHELIETATELLQIERDLVEETLLNMQDDAEIILQDLPDPDSHEMSQMVYYVALYHSEKRSAERLFDLIHDPRSRLEKLHRLSDVEWESMIESITGRDGVRLTDQQRQAVQITLTSKVSILTGGPGTGKTTTLRTIIAVLESKGCRFKLASPTGRAAKRLSEATGHSAQTLHRLLGFAPQEGFTFNTANPLDADIVVVDEASMVDLLLFFSLLKALRPHTHLLLVGDVDQLPSVGAGDVLRDVIRSQICPVIRLETVFRQADDSMIIENAHRINQGRSPDTSNKSADFFFFRQDEPEAAAQMLIDVVKNRIPEKFGFDAMNDVQVLAPMYNGRVGVNALNDELQQALNPPGRLAEKRLNGRSFRVGDKVMQMRNNYEKEVYNGDIGRIHSIDMHEHLINVMIDNRLVSYRWIESDELVHAYAISVHKSQGAEYPCVVIPVMTQHYMMLQRNLLYTAVTRAKQMVVLVGTRKAINIAVRNNKIAKRYTALAWRLSPQIE